MKLILYMREHDKAVWLQHLKFDIGYLSYNCLTTIGGV